MTAVGALSRSPGGAGRAAGWRDLGAACLLAGAILLIAPAVIAADLTLGSATADTTRLQLVPNQLSAQPGDTLVVSFTVPVAGPAFNAYDAYLSYDPASLQYLRPTNLAAQEGPLMTAACGQRFHVFAADTLAGNLRVSHSLLCNGKTVAGPGVVYSVRFRCRNVDAQTPLALLVTAPNRTAFYMAGTLLSPLVASGATVHVGAGTTSAVPAAGPGLALLRAAPNPFNPRTVISFDAPSGGDAAVDIHGVDGRRLRTLWRGRIAPGTWRGEWDGCDDAGRMLAAGVYLIRARAGGSEAATRIVLLK